MFAQRWLLRGVGTAWLGLGRDCGPSGAMAYAAPPVLSLSRWLLKALPFPCTGAVTRWPVRSWCASRSLGTSLHASLHVLNVSRLSFAHPLLIRSDCALSIDYATNKTVILAGLNYEPNPRGPKIYVYEFPPQHHLWCVGTCTSRTIEADGCGQHFCTPPLPSRTTRWALAVTLLTWPLSCAAG